MNTDADKNQHDEGTPRQGIGDRNIDRLIGEAYDPAAPRAEYVAAVEARLRQRAREGAGQAPSAGRYAVSPRAWRRWGSWAIAAAAVLVAAVAVWNNLRAGPTPPERPAVGNTAEPAPPIAPSPTPGEPRDGAPPVEPKAIVRLSEATPEAPRTELRPDDDLMRPSELAPPAAQKPSAAGETIETKPDERRRVALADGSVLYLNAGTRVKIEADRRVTLSKGEVYVEVAPLVASGDAAQAASGDALRQGGQGTFLLSTPRRQVTALGTRFRVREDAGGTSVLVTQGRVKVSGLADLLYAGSQLQPAGEAAGPRVVPVARDSAELEWMKDLMREAASPLVPASQYAGGALIAADPQGQPVKLSLRKFHVDVYVQDGFARTTIDQTYFNHDVRRLEGTFYFPLPPDASLSRLAMYVNGQLMEGGMAERDYARKVYESIVTKMKDPALLEWVDGSTFKMRVFPLEGRQEKRIILSYVQRLPSEYGKAEYRFPAGHSLEFVKDWSFHARVAGILPARGMGVSPMSSTCILPVRVAGILPAIAVSSSSAPPPSWASPSHQLAATADGPDLLLDVHEANARLNRDVVLKLWDAVPQPPAGATGETPVVPTAQDSAAFRAAYHEGAKYLMLRYRPAIEPKSRKEQRDWIFLFESSGDRNPLLARAQVEIVRAMLENVEHTDRFAILSAGTRTTRVTQGFEAASPRNVRAAVAALEKTHLVGALDLEQALAAASALARDGSNVHIVHVGSATPILGKRRQEALVKMLGEAQETETTEETAAREETAATGKMPVVHTGGTPVLRKQQMPAPRYVGVGVGKKWNRSFMKAAAAKTGGYFTQINPDENIPWRGFDLLSTLNTPRLMDVKVVDSAERATFLCDCDAVSHGQELCAIARVDGASPLPASVVVTGTLDGKRISKVIRVTGVPENLDAIDKTVAAGRTGDSNAPAAEKAAATGAGYLPRAWAKMEIDRLVEEGAEKNRPRIVELSKSMYVMSPFTSLLVLENEAMYQQYNVDRGRKDHWAMYPASPTIPVVAEGLEPAAPSTSSGQAPSTGSGQPAPASDAKKIEEVLSTILVRVPPRLLRFPSEGPYYTVPYVTAWQAITGAYAIPCDYTYGYADDSDRRGTFLDDIQIDFLIQATQAQTAYPSTLAAPRLTIWNGQPATWTALDDLSTTVSIPGNGTLLLGGQRYFGEIEREGGAPILSKIPILRRLFTNEGKVRDEQTVLILIKPNIIIHREEEDRFFPPLSPEGMSFNQTHGETVNLPYADGRVGFALGRADLMTWDDSIYSSSGDSLLVRDPSVHRSARDSFLIGPYAYDQSISGGTSGRTAGGTNTYTGGTLVTVPGAMGSGTVYLNSGATLYPIANDYAFASVSGALVSHTFGGLTFDAGGQTLSTGILNAGNGITISSGSTITTNTIADFTNDGYKINWNGTPAAAMNLLPGGPVYVDGVTARLSFAGSIAAWDNPVLNSLSINGAYGMQPQSWPFVGAASDTRYATAVDIQSAIRRRDYGQALRLMDQALKADPTNQALREQRFILQQVELLQREKGLSPSYFEIQQSLNGIRESEIPWYELLRYPKDWSGISGGRQPVAPSGGTDAWRGPRVYAIDDLITNVPGFVGPRMSLDMRTGGTVMVDASTNQLVFTGTPEEREDLDRIIRLIEEIDHPVSAGSVLYQRPVFSGDSRVFTDLLSYAPGMNTSLSDIQAVLEAEGPAGFAPAPGRIDPAAAKLIERARSAGWRTVTFAGEGPRSSEDVGPWHRETDVGPWHPSADIVITFDGAGRFVRETRTAHGLVEKVCCDGNTILHLYPELGVGARRTVSRFHRAELAAAIPMLVPPAEDLARGASVVALDDHTVAVTPRGMGVSPMSGGGILPPQTPDFSTAETSVRRMGMMPMPPALLYRDGSVVPYVQVRLVFGEDGQLAERRTVAMPSGAVLTRQTYSADGAIRAIGGAGGGVRSQRKLDLRPADMPDLRPDLSQLVILPMPIRTRASILKGDPTRNPQAYDDLDEDFALRLLSADLAERSGESVPIVGRRFFLKGDRRIGFYTLLFCGGLTFDAQTQLDLRDNKVGHFDPRQDHPYSPLAAYMSGLDHNLTYLGEYREVAPNIGKGFVEDLAAFRCLCHFWHSGQVLEGADPARREQGQWDLDFAARCHSPLMAWTVLSGAADCGGSPDWCRSASKAFDRLSSFPGLGYYARYESARALRWAGDWQAASARFLDLYRRTLRGGVLPPIDGDFRAAFAGGDANQQAQLARLMRGTSAELLKRNDYGPAVVLACQCLQLGEPAGDELLTAALGAAPRRQRPGLGLAVFSFLWRHGRTDGAESLLQPAMDDPRWSASPYVWRLGWLLARKQGRWSKAALYLDKALDIEYRAAREPADLQAVRQDYGALMDACQKLARALSALDAEAPRDLPARVVRAADRWRAMDPDETAACQAAAGVLSALGEGELAWEYLTTPLAQKPSEAAPWVSLAAALRQQGDLALSDRAYARAFEAEPTNAQVLWDRAQVLQQMGQSARARELYRQLSNGAWEARFDGLKAQARQQVNP